MRRAILPGLLALVPVVFAQTISEISSDELFPESEIEDGHLVTEGSSDFIALEAQDDSLEPHGVRIDLTWSHTNRATDDEKGYFMTPINGKGLTAFTEYRLRSIEVAKGGPCHMVYKNTSVTEPPLPDGIEAWEKTERMSFPAEGGKFEFRGPDAPANSQYSIINMEYVYCGAEDDFKGIGPGVPGGKCEDAIYGDLSTDLLTICCAGAPFWKPDVWTANDLDSYMRSALEAFNKKGWPSSIMGTFATHNMETQTPANELKEQPSWEWSCSGINGQCSVNDLSDQDACPVDPKRAVVLRALENLANMWMSSRTKFTEDALTEIVLPLPALSKALFPNTDRPTFDAPEDYGDSSWVMIGGGILGVLTAPIALVSSLAAVSPALTAASGIISGIMWLVGLSLGPTEGVADPEEDPIFSNFADFSNDDVGPFVKSIYKVYSDVFDYFFVSKPKGAVDVDKVMDLFKGGVLIPRDDYGEMRNISDFQQIENGMKNTFIAPLVNLAWRRQEVYIVKLPAKGIEFWTHRDSSLTNPGVDRTSVTWDPCGGHSDGDVGYRQRYETSERKAPSSWTKDIGEVEDRAICNGDGSGHAFLAWGGHTDHAWADFGFKNVRENGLQLERIVEKTTAQQASQGFDSGNAKTLDEKIAYMADHAGAFVNDFSAIESWNIPVCDLTKAHDTAMGLIPVHNCLQVHRNGYNGNDKYLDAKTCISHGIRAWCTENQKDGKGADWPYAN